MDVMFGGYESHMVTEETRSIIDESDLSYGNTYIRWFFKMSHPYMVQNAPEDPPSPVHQEILEEE